MTQAKHLNHVLWQPLNDGSKPHVFAVIDCARDKRLEPLINNSGLKHECLYSGKLNYALKRAAPHIVQLAPGHPFTQTLLSEGWGQSWGIFYICRNDVTLSQVRNSCRRIAKAQSPQGKTLVFRYYDPRVLRPFLPVCNPHEVEAILASALSIVVEAEKPDNYRLYRRDGKVAVLSVQEHPCNQAYEKDVSDSSPVTSKRMPMRFLHIRQPHLDALNKNIEEQELNLIQKDYIEIFLQDHSNSDDTSDTPPSSAAFDFSIGDSKVELDDFTRTCYKNAKEFGIQSRVNVLDFMQLNQQHGWKFWQSHQHAWSKKILESNRPEEEKLESINKKFSRMLLEGMWG